MLRACAARGERTVLLSLSFSLPLSFVLSLSLAISLHVHRSTSQSSEFHQRNSISKRCNNTLLDRMQGFPGDPFHRRQKLLVLLVLCGLAFALCSLAFVVPIGTVCVSGEIITPHCVMP